MRENLRLMKGIIGCKEGWRIKEDDRRINRGDDRIDEGMIQGFKEARGKEMNSGEERSVVGWKD